MNDLLKTEEIRNVVKTDIPQLKELIDSTGLFPSELLDEMLDNYFSGNSTSEIWLTSVNGSTLAGICYCAPERMTEGTYNLYLIAVRSDLQRKKTGRKMLAFLEELLRKNEARILLVETSGLPEFERTREFYLKTDFLQVAEINDFYREGESKIVFWKKL